MIITSDYKTLQRISGIKSPYRKGDWYRPFRFIQNEDHSFSTIDEAQHTAIRQKIAPAYAGTKEMEEMVGTQVKRAIALIERKYLCAGDTDDFKPMDLAAVAHFFTLDVVGELQFGQAFGYLDDGEDVFGFMKWNEDFFSVAATVGVLPLLGRITQQWPFSELLPKSSDPTGLGRFIRHAEEVMEKRYKAGEFRRDMIGMFMKKGVTVREAVNQSLVQVVAGTDSIATSIRMTILYVSSSPRIHAKLVAELDRAAAAGLLSDPIQPAEARELPYLQAVLREGLRIYPGGVPLSFKTVPADGDDVNGYRLPGGTQVGMDVWGALHDQAFWGADADVFRPERWLEVDAARYREMIDCLDFLFGYGRYQCLGRSIVFMEMNMLVPELLRRLEFAVVNPVRPAKIKAAGFYVMHGFDVVVTRRKEAVG